MDKIVIEGGRRLEGEIRIAGAKNAALPALAATLLCPGKFVFSNVPDLKDIETMCKLLAEMGAVVKKESSGILTVDTERLEHCEASYDLVRTMRASCLVLGPLLARLGKSRISLPGGCAIGERPINLHLKGFQNLGAHIALEEGYVNASAPDGLAGQKVYFDLVTVTGTENLMMAAVGAKGTTILENAAREPEVTFLADMLNKMGADIQGAGTDRVVINGGRTLKAVEIAVIPDRVETGTFMAAAAITGGHLKLTGCTPLHLEAVTLKLIEMGCTINEGNDWLEVSGPKRPHPVDIETDPYPSFPTDMQAQAMAVLTVADGTSVITESVFENRYMHVAELRRMGANILHKGKNAFVGGVEKLSGAQVMATDLRASASLIVAGLAAKGKTHVRRVYHLDRGYEKIEEKLKKVGASIARRADRGGE
ncbi:MAG: UDP-N-acetylglucosamine 1-carboxyvinyltransferase [Nitrospinae bacterium]|nr:UDP-N-acetylglucosamine 1-carboxyvinyltransferase [Nitrospinota bacterium]